MCRVKGFTSSQSWEQDSLRRGEEPAEISHRIEDHFTSKLRLASVFLGNQSGFTCFCVLCSASENGALHVVSRPLPKFSLSVWPFQACFVL